MLSVADASQVAASFDLGDVVAMTGPVARGVIGQIWRLETDRGTWAVKEWFGLPDMDELTEGVGFQEAAMAAGVPAPPVVHASNGSWSIALHGAPVRAQGWVDLLDADPCIDQIDMLLDAVGA